MEHSFFLVEDNGLGAQVRQHHLCSFLGKPYVVHLEFGEILSVGAGDDRGDAVKVDRLFKVVFISYLAVLRGESLSVCGGCCIGQPRAEEWGLRRSGAIEIPILGDAPHLVLVDNEGEAPGSSSVSGRLERCCDFRDLVFEDVDGPVLRCSHNAGEVCSIETGLEHRVDGGGARGRHVATILAHSAE